MTNDDRCVFCGNPAGALLSTNVICGKTYQLACRDCAKELKALSNLDRCRKALILGLADCPHKLHEYIRFCADAEDRRPKCPSCGGSLRYTGEQYLGTASNHVYAPTSPVWTACCDGCGRYEFFNSDILRKNPHLDLLFRLDTGDT